MRQLFLHSLRGSGYQGDIVFLLVGGPLNETDAAVIRKYEAKTKDVDLIPNIDGKRKQYPGVLTKVTPTPTFNSLLLTSLLLIYILLRLVITHPSTKLRVWEMVEYTQIIYYDTDFVFLKNPESALTLCGKETLLCAVPDRYQALQDPFLVGKYFNSGFLVLRPDLCTFTLL